MDKQNKWYQKPIGIIALLILFFPVGLYLMWKYATWNKSVKWVITVVFVLAVLGNMGGNKNSSTNNSSSQISTPTIIQVTVVPTQAVTSSLQQTEELTKIPLKVANTTAPIESKQSVPASNGTVSQSNAVRKAKSYLSYTAFSHDGLVAQLEYEKFSHDDAVYGADNSGANWNEQAAKKAKSYMDMSAYSRDGLIDQLKYEKFTQEQSEYGANAVGL